jgi:hypothetical protein
MAIAVSASAADDVVRFDFETGDLQHWMMVEGKFDRLVSDRDVFHNAYPERPDRKYNKQGKYYLSTVEQQPGMPSNDRMTGMVESPVFVLGGPDMSMLVGSGTQAKAYVALCTLDGKEVLVARGKEQTEIMQRVAWHAPELVGKRVFLRVVDRETGGWGHVTFDGFTAEGHIDRKATRQRFAGIAERVARQRFEEVFKQLHREALRAAIDDSISTFGDRYPRGKEFLTRLDAIEEQIRGVDFRSVENRQVDHLARELEILRREALIANPLVSGRPILYVVRRQYQSHYHAIDTLFHTGELNADRGMCPHANLFQGGGALKTIDLSRFKPQAGKPRANSPHPDSPAEEEGAVVKTLLETRDGVARDPEVYFDGKKIVFALRRNAAEDYHIWEINADGAGLRQLTSAEGVSDVDPIYLPDDSIVFSSTREPKYNMCSRDHGANLFRMAADGANIHQIGKNNLFDNQPSLMPDGRILYARWEYVDRNFGDAHALWTANPDGSNQSLYWKNNTASPAAALAARSIPGTQRAVCVLGPHHDHLWGAMALVDRRLALEGRDGVVRIWPPQAMSLIRAGGPFDCDAFSSVQPKYADPCPLDDKHFLCSRSTPAGPMGIYLLDVFGNEILLHAEGPGCYDPMPLKPQPRPPVLPARREFEAKPGCFLVADVYRGTHVQGVKRGSVKTLRVVESPEKRHWSPGAWFGQGYTAPGMNWHSLENKRILGTVPVEEDGSAFFRVPADTFVYFQLLDAGGMMIQSMRSGASVHAGEVGSCVGCHDERRTAPPANRPAALPMALRRGPSAIQPWHGPPREFSFMAEVQPVFTRNCVSCHDYGQEAGKKLNLAPDRTTTFNTAYVELWRKGCVKCVGAGPAEIQQAYSWGSHPSRLVQVLRTPKYPGHENLKLTPEELDRIITWVDLNGVYYPTYMSAYPNSLTGRVPLDNVQLGRLGQLTGWDFGAQRSFSGCPGPDVSFDRPELSPCLAPFKDHSDAKYKEALAIIQAGKENLAKRPRGDDLEGFVPCEADQRREKKFAARRETELRNREAVRRGDKLYDR